MSRSFFDSFLIVFSLDVVLVRRTIDYRRTSIFVAPACVLRGFIEVERLRTSAKTIDDTIENRALSRSQKHRNKRAKTEQQIDRRPFFVGALERTPHRPEIVRDLPRSDAEARSSGPKRTRSAQIALGFALGSLRVALGALLGKTPRKHSLDRPNGRGLANRRRGP